MIGSGIFFPISAIPFSILIIFLFIKKGYVVNDETKIYKNLIILNFCGLLIEILCTFASLVYNDFTMLSNIIYKTYLIYLLGWTGLFTLYIVKISRENNNKIAENVLKYGIIISIIIVFSLPIKLVMENFQNRYTTGLSVTFSYLISGIMIFYIICILIKNRKKVFNKKYIPVFAFLFIGTFAIILQMIMPSLLLLTYVETLICVIMYFTIENPDVKILNELYKNKELMEQNYEDKYNFLFEITQEARNPLINISSLCNEIKNENDCDKIKLGVSAINNLVKQLDFSINNVLNISSLDIQKLRFIDSKYDLLKLCNELVLRISNNIYENVNFKYEFPKVVPILYGDNMKIRQILYSLLINSAKYTKSGFIEFKVSILERYDVCRVICTISDTGSGMSIEQINDILSATGELDKQELENIEKQEYNIKLCQKIVKIMGGSLMIKADVVKGTEIKIVIDQRIYHEKGSSILNQYENIINNYKKILVVSQDKKLIDKIKKKCNENNITYVTLLYGKDAIDRIKSKKRYDYILISDEMKEMSGLMTCQEMKKISGFKIPIIVMLNGDKENIKEDYLNEGFSDYILIDNIDTEMNRIINKY